MCTTETNTSEINNIPTQNSKEITGEKEWGMKKCCSLGAFQVNNTMKSSVCVCVCVCVSLSRVCLFVTPARLLCPWNSPGKNTGVDCHSLPQRIFPTQGLNPCLLHHRQILYHLSYREVLKAVLWVFNRHKDQGLRVKNIFKKCPRCH